MVLSTVTSNGATVIIDGWRYGVGLLICLLLSEHQSTSMTHYANTLEDVGISSPLAQLVTTEKNKDQAKMSSPESTFCAVHCPQISRKVTSCVYR